MNTPIESLSWEQLNAYRLDVFPDNLTVITNANPQDFVAACVQFHQEHQTGSGPAIEEILRSSGFAAVTAQNQTR